MLDSGTRLGPYEIVDAIGAGGMGEVYRAKDTRLDRQVAVKVLPPGMSDNPDLRQRFEREAKTISSLNHPHICILYDVGHQEGTDYLVMELLDGETLAHRLEKGPLPTEQVLRYGVQIAEALGKAHRQGITHRDLKPGNIMITKSSGAKLLDFGLAKYRQQLEGAQLDGITGMATEQKNLTAEGAIVGTFQYMAPEQLEGQEADPRTDIFAFGAVLYEMVTGRRAFEGKTRTSLIAAIVDRDPPPISSLQPLSPPALERVIRTCLAKDPDDRWQTAHDVLLQLRWIAEAGSQAGVAAPVVASRKRRERLMAMTLVAALLAAGTFAALWMRERTARKPVPLTLSLIPPPNMQFSWSGVVLSPDGSRLAFINDAQVSGHGGSSGPAHPLRAIEERDTLSSQRIYIRQLGNGLVTALPGTENADLPFWSPDSRNLGFFANGKLKRVSTSGGVPQTLCDVESPRGGTWGSDGTIVFTPVFRDGLFKISSSGGAVTRVTRIDPKKGETNHRWPAFLPDGKHVLFLVQRAEGGAPDDPSTIDLLSLESGKRKEVVRANSSVLYSREGYVLYWRERSLIAQGFDARRLSMEGDPFAVATEVAYGGDEYVAASVSDNGSLAYLVGGSLREARLTWFDRAGKELGTEGEIAAYVTPSISPDGKRIVVELNQGSGDIWALDLDRHTRSRVTVDPGDEFSPVWSPDGTRIAYGSNEPPIGLWIVPASGGDGKRVWLGEEPNPFDWSGDDLILIDFNDSKLKRGIGLVSAKDGSFRSLVQTRFTEVAPGFSPDGKWIVYMSDQSGRFEIYAQSIEGGQRWQVSTEGGYAPRWSRDGKEIYYLMPDLRSLMAVAVTTSPGFRAGIPERLFQVRRANSYDALDRNRFLVSIFVGDDKVVPVTLVQNWTMLRKE